MFINPIDIIAIKEATPDINPAIIILERLRAECERWTSTTEDVPPGKRRKDNLDIFTREKYGKLSGEPELWIDEEK